jgi:hypothetical protein
VEEELAKAFAMLAFNTMKSLVGSELFAQATYEGSQREADDLTVRKLTEAFVCERPLTFTPRMDAQHKSANDAATGDYLFTEDDPRAMELWTRIQALQRLREARVPAETITAFKKLCDEGKSPYEAAVQVMAEIEENQGARYDDPIPFQRPDESSITDALARQQISNAPIFVQQAYGKARRNRATPAKALEDALEVWRKSQSEAG